MIEQGHFEIANTSAGWVWEVYDGDLTLTVSPGPSETSQAARTEVDRVRDALAEVERIDEFESIPDSSGHDRSQITIRGDESGDIFDWALKQGETTLAVPN